MSIPEFKLNRPFFETPFVPAVGVDPNEQISRFEAVLAKAIVEKTEIEKKPRQERSTAERINYTMLKKDIATLHKGIDDRVQYLAAVKGLTNRSIRMAEYIDFKCHDKKVQIKVLSSRYAVEEDCVHVEVEENQPCKYYVMAYPGTYNVVPPYFRAELTAFQLPSSCLDLSNKKSVHLTFKVNRQLWDELNDKLGVNFEVNTIGYIGAGPTPILRVSAIE